MYLIEYHIKEDQHEDEKLKGEGQSDIGQRKIDLA